MPSTFTHIFVAGAMGKTGYREEMPFHFWFLAAVCSVIPDMDIIGFYTGVRYGSLFGHRGFSHSLPFALLVAVFVVLFSFRPVARFSRAWWGLLLFYFLVTASHGVLDAMTDKGYGVAFLSPFTNTRYFMPWRPIPASPMSIGRFFSHSGLVILLKEMLWIWLPMIGTYFSIKALRRGSGACGTIGAGDMQDS